MRRSVVIPISCLTLAAMLAVGCASDSTKKRQHFERGAEYMKKGDYRQAIVEYRGALQIDEKYGEARYQLATAYEKIGDWAQARRETIRAADLMPDNVDAQLQAGRILQMTGEFEDAVSRAQHVLESHPQNVDALMLLGNASAHLKDSDKAVAILEASVKQSPDDPRLLQALGTLQKGRGKNEAAEQAFKRAVELQPHAVEPREALAMYYWSAKQPDKAEQILKDALLMNPGSLELNRDLASFYFMEGRNDEAETSLTQVLQRTPGDTTLRMALGDIHLRKREFDKARAEYQLLLKNEASTTLGVTRLARLDYGTGKKPQAFARLQERAKAVPKDADVQTLLGRFLLAEGKFREAEAAARVALETDAESFEALYTLGTALVEQNKVDEAMPIFLHAAKVGPDGVGPKLQLARIYLSRGNPEKAREFAQDALNINDQLAEGRLLMARALLALGKAADAAPLVRDLERQYPNSADAHSLAGDWAIASHRPEDARTAYTKALALKGGDDFQALNGLIVLNIGAGKKDEALALVNKALATHSRDPKWMLLAAQTYLAVNDDVKAESMLKDLLKASPDTFEAYGSLAVLYARQHKLADARAQFEHMVKQQPSVPGPQTMLAILLQLEGKPREAQAVYEHLLQANPDSPIAANNLAMLLMESGGNLDVALNYAQAANKALPNDADINDTLGLVYYKKGLSSRAVRAFEASTKTSPRNPDFWLHLGQAHADAGDKPKAREALQRALSIDPTFAGAPVARKALDDLNRKTSN